MKVMRKWIPSAVALLVFATNSLIAAAIAPEFAGDYAAVDLGSVTGLPAEYGGLTFAAGDVNTLLIGGQANTSAGLFYSVPVLRGAGNHITGFGPASALGFGAYNDGGIAYGPGGVLFYSRWPVNQLGQVEAGSATDDRVIDLGPLGVASSHAALAFVPAGYNGARRFKMLSWSGGEFYDAVLTADGAGTYDVTSVAQTAVLPGGPEGFIYVPIGSPLFPNQSMLVSDWSAGRVSAYEIDAEGDPVAATRKDFVLDLTGAEGAVIDPLTGDFLFSTFRGGNRIVRVEGFAIPVPTGIPEPATTLSALSGTVFVLLWRRRMR
jgi:hypothetical protein